MLKAIRDLNVVQELMLILAIPLLILLTLLGREVTSNYKELQILEQSEAVFRITAEVGSLVQLIAQEREFSLRSLENSSFLPQLSQASAAVDKKWTSLEENRISLAEDFEIEATRIETAYSNLNTARELLLKARGNLQKNSKEEPLFIKSFNDANVYLINFIQKLYRCAHDHIIAQQLQSSLSIISAIEEIEMSRTLTGSSLMKKSISSNIQKELLSSKIRMQQLEEDFYDIEEESQVTQLKNLFQMSQLVSSNKIVENLISSAEGPIPDHFPTLIEWYGFIDIVLKNLQQFEQSFLSNIQNEIMLRIDENEKSSLYIFLMISAAIAIPSYLSYLSVSAMKKQFKLLDDSFASIAQGDLRYFVPLDGTDEFGILASSINNNLIENTRSVVIDLGKASSTINDSTQDLASAVKVIMTTSNQQSAGVKEVVSTMEDTDQLSKQISNNILDVKETISKTQSEIERGFTKINDNQEIMELIRGSSDSMIQGIKTLSEQINSIWDIVNIINSIADQTKIIAFNAELEASSAGEAGKNFQIVATEIRRLADNTVSSTDDIRKKIGEIQRSSDQLIVKAEDGTSKVQTGWEASQDLKTIFSSVRDASIKTVETTSVVSKSVQQQVYAFEQILLTMKQISEGINNFVGTTSGMTTLSQHLHTTSNQLQQIVNRYKLPN
jgi:methyl-accepting chemotaxis protein